MLPASSIDLVIGSFWRRRSSHFPFLNFTRDEVDSANDNILLAADMRFSNRESLYYKKIVKTLTKVETEQYGMCDECGDPITYTRLIARPTSEMCILCKEESEREENQNFFERRSKSLGREMSVSAGTH